MVENIRLFKGAQELNYRDLIILKTNDDVLNTAKFSIEAESTVGAGSLIDFNKNDGVTTIFSAKVNTKKEIDLWKIEAFTNGYELNNVFIEKVYSAGTTPEEIVEDVVDNFTTSLTFASAEVSGFSYTGKYFANAYALDVIKDQLELLDWQIRIDQNDNVYFEPKGHTNNGVVFTNGTNCQIENWDEDQNPQFNSVKVVGGFKNYNLSETKAGNTTVFSITEKPSGDVRATVSGSIVDPDDYTVDPQNKTVTFDSTKTNPTFDYSFDRPVVVVDQDEDSVSEFTEIFERIEAPWLNNFQEARRYAKELLAANSQPFVSAKIIEPGLNFNTEVGEEIIVTDPLRDKSETLVISEIKIRPQENTTEYRAGRRIFVFHDWQKKVQDKIKKLERRLANETTLNIARLFKHKMNIKLTLTTAFQKNYPQNSFILSHPTLSYPRDDFNDEPDCSDNGHYGTWQGSGISGSQFDLSGFRLSAGEFNGSDNYIQIPDATALDLSGNDFSIALSVKVSSLPGTTKYLLNKWNGTDGYAVRIASDNKVELIYSNSGTDNTIKANTALIANTFQHLVFVKDSNVLTVYVAGVSDNTDTGTVNAGTNTENLEIGRYSSDYHDGWLDEVRLYNSALTPALALDVFNKIMVDSGLQGYWPMDNNYLGNRETSRVNVT